jgi:ankyrin repeat protein
MFKKKMCSVFLSATMLFSSASLVMANENNTNQNNTTAEFSEKIENFKKDENMQNLLTNQELSQEDLEIQSRIISYLEEQYFSKKVWTKEDKYDVFSTYVDAIQIGYNDLADSIWNYSLSDENFNIDLSYYSKRNITPLMAASMSEIEGGNVEYAIKLIELGADPEQTTKKNNISPLSLSAVNDNYKVLTALIVAGANPLKKDDMGLTTYDYAKKHESQRSTLILLSVMESFINQ